MAIIFGDYERYLELRQELLNILDELEFKYFQQDQILVSPAKDLQEKKSEVEKLTPDLDEDVENIGYVFSTSKWSHDSGATIYFEAENKSERSIENPTYQFSSNFKIKEKETDIWGAQIIEEKITENGYEYILQINQSLSSGEIYRFGFNTGESSPDILSRNEPPPDSGIEETNQASENKIPFPQNNTGLKNESSGFYTANGKIYDANGKEFIARGVNNRHVWFDHGNGSPALNSLDNIANFGFNAVRIVWEIDHDPGIIANRQGNLTDDALLERIIEETINNQMIPVLELHDFTGRNNNEELLNEGVSWWVERAEVWQKYEKYLMINIANEFGDYFKARDNPSEFPQVYKEAITMIREAGINNTIVIDSFNYGKDYEILAEYGQEIYDHDPQKNVVFSVHFYCGAGENPDEIKEAFDLMTGQNLPFIIGEYSTTHAPCGDIREDFIMEQAELYGIGSFAWAWDDQEWALAANSNWEASSLNELTQFGKDVIDHVGQDGEIASIF